MICIKSQHFSLNRILFLVIGLWPYQQSRLTRFQAILLLGILTSAILFQFTTFITTKLSLNLAIKILSSIFCCTIFLFKYVSFWINIQTIKRFLEQLQHICNELKDENEIAIMKRYGYYTRRYTIKMISLISGGLFIIIVQPFFPHILSVFLLTNKSHSHPKLLVETEYFIDQEKYFYLILLHIDVAASIGAIAMIATGTILVGSLKHACGIFKVASYRIKQAISIAMLVNIKLEDEIAIYKNMTYAVDIHCKATQFITYLNTSFEGLFFFLIMITVCALSLNLYQVFQLALRGGDMEEFLFHLVCVGLILLYMFLANYIGQEITDHNSYVFFTAYHVQWYLAPLHVQKLILFLLQKGNKPFYCNVGKLFVASLEGFAMLINASMSYFTVMYSTQQ